MREPLQIWFDRWTDEYANSSAYFRDKASEQIMFVRDELATLVWTGVPYLKRENEGGSRNSCKITSYVIGEHQSKSVRLPIYLFERTDLGIQLLRRVSPGSHLRLSLREPPSVVGLPQSAGPVDRNLPLHAQRRCDPAPGVAHEGIASEGARRSEVKCIVGYKGRTCPRNTSPSAISAPSIRRMCRRPRGILACAELGRHGGGRHIRLAICSRFLTGTSICQCSASTMRVHPTRKQGAF